ncbi:fibrinogen C domain-containing protein 1-A-like [Branchiostoma floridae]|uniref:Fibrinogen C domain-containing protein 1-A-like n=2 Tax=Branchiostoma floridae TaxID=7739 RepID=A0A9J7M9L0_BRAFL|nr:fibrinogen C domain-containing protein 1-A-like [Branchiostoma floridae]
MTSTIKPKMLMLLVLAVCTLAWGEVGTLADIPVGSLAGQKQVEGPDTTNENLNPHVDGVQRNDPPPGAADFEDCADLFPLLYWTSTVHDGIFPIKPRSSADHFDVYCDMTTDGGGWTVIQRRVEGRLNFDRYWADYEDGFGRVEGEHWLGLDKIYNLTSQNSYELYVELGDWEGNFAHAKYATFSIGDESTDYTLHIGGYSGDAGDSLDYSNGMKFSATNMDNDESSSHCAQVYSGGWWYGNCAYSVLNGPYYQPEDYHGSATGVGVYWSQWKGYYYSLKATKMMVRPRNFVRNL